MEEIYDIKDFEERYGITINGVVYSYPKEKCRFKTLRILKQQLDKDGYCTVFLYKNGIAYHMRVHKLVAETFLNKQDFKSMPDEDRNLVNLDDLEVNHKNEIKTDNRLENLEFCTSKYNANYGMRNIKTIDKISKPIIQYDLNMNEICTYKSGYEIKTKLGYDNSTIAKRCKDHKKGYGFYWRYANEQARIRENHK